MELEFIGRGAAFNTKEGNNSAYFIENNKLFLIDCGESVFERLIENELLENINEIYLLITHTHSDHIGSIGTLTMYSYYVLNKQLNIILPTDAKYLTSIENIMNGFGCTKEMYNYIDESMFDNIYNTFQGIRFFETKHFDGLNCYGITFNTENGIVYYSGDTNEISYLQELIKNDKLIDKIYMDTTTDNYNGNVHFNIYKLYKSIPDKLKSHIYCMHLNNDDCIEIAKTLGLNVVEVDKKINKKLSLIRDKK